MQVWWLSFADEHRNLGVIITEDQEDGDLVECLQRLHLQGIDPGGEVAAATMPLDELEDWVPDNMERLISPGEMHELGYLTRGEHKKMEEKLRNG